MKIAYVFTEVPDLPGAFPGAELHEMADRGVAIEVFILRNRRPKTEEGRRIEERFPVHRSPYSLSIRLIGSVLAATLRHPILVAQTILETIRNATASPKILIKSLAILPKSIRFAALVQREDVTLIHAYWASLPALAANVMARFSGVPYTTWAHAGSDIYNKNHQTEAALRARLHEAVRVFTCNRVNLEHFAQLAGGDVLNKVRLLTHGVVVEQFRAVPQTESIGKPVLLAVGRLSPAKGFDVLIRACDLLRRRGYDFVCRIAGAGVVESELHRLVDSLQLSDVVRFLGHVDHSDLPDLYRGATIFVAPSVIGPKGSRDGLPNVLLEAMTAGVACVGSRTASIPEVIEDGVTGLLVTPGLAEPLTDALARLIDDRALRQGLAAAGAKLVTASYGRKSAMDRLYGEFEEIHGAARHAEERPA